MPESFYIRDPRLFADAASQGVRDSAVNTQSVISAFQAPIEAYQRFQQAEYYDALGDAQRYETQFKTPLEVKLRELQIATYGNDQMLKDAELANKLLDATKKQADITAASSLIKSQQAEYDENQTFMDRVGVLTEPQYRGDPVPDAELIEATQVLRENPRMAGRKSNQMEDFYKLKAQDVLGQFESRPSLKAADPDGYAFLKNTVLGPAAAAQEARLQQKQDFETQEQEFVPTKAVDEEGNLLSVPTRSASPGAVAPQGSSVSGSSAISPVDAATQAVSGGGTGAPTAVAVSGGGLITQSGGSFGSEPEGDSAFGKDPALSPERQLLAELKAERKPLVDEQGEPLLPPAATATPTPQPDRPLELTEVEPGVEYPGGTTMTVVGEFPAEQIGRGTPQLTSRREFIERYFNRIRLQNQREGKRSTQGALEGIDKNIRLEANEMYNEAAKPGAVAKKDFDSKEEAKSREKVTEIITTLDEALTTIEGLGKESTLGPGLAETARREVRKFEQGEAVEDIELVEAYQKIERAIASRKDLTNTTGKEVDAYVESQAIKPGYPNLAWTYGNLRQFVDNARNVSTYNRAKEIFLDTLETENGGMLGAQVFDRYVNEQRRGPNGRLIPADMSPKELSDRALRYVLPTGKQKVGRQDNTPATGQAPVPEQATRGVAGSTSEQAPSVRPPPSETGSDVRQPESSSGLRIPSRAEVAASFGKKSTKKPVSFLERVSDAIVPPVEAQEPDESPGTARPTPSPLPPAIDAQIERFGAEYDVPPVLLRALSGVESGYAKNLGPSSSGALGVLQLLPLTAAEEALPAGASRAEKTKLSKDPRFLSQIKNNHEFNVQLGTKHMARLLKHYDGDVITAVRAYNQGRGTLQNNPKGGQDYALLVFDQADRLQAGRNKILDEDFQKKSAVTRTAPEQIVYAEDDRPTAPVTSEGPSVTARPSALPARPDTSVYEDNRTTERPVELARDGLPTDAEQRRLFAEAQAKPKVREGDVSKFLRQQFPDIKQQYDADPEFAKTTDLALQDYFKELQIAPAFVNSMADNVTFGQADKIGGAVARLAAAVTPGEALPLEVYQAAYRVKIQQGGKTWAGTAGDIAGFGVALGAVKRGFAVANEGIQAARGFSGQSSNANKLVQTFKKYLRRTAEMGTTAGLQNTGRGESFSPGFAAGGLMEAAASTLHLVISRGSKPLVAAVGAALGGGYGYVKGESAGDTLKLAGAGVAAGLTGKGLLNVGGRIASGISRAETSQVPSGQLTSKGAPELRSLTGAEDDLLKNLERVSPNAGDELLDAVTSAEKTGLTVLDTRGSPGVSQVASEVLSEPGARVQAARFSQGRASGGLADSFEDDLAKAATSEGVPAGVIAPAVRASERKAALTGAYEPEYQAVFKKTPYITTRLKDPEIIAAAKNVASKDPNRFMVIDDVRLTRLAKDPQIKQQIKEASRDVYTKTAARRYDVWQGVAQQLRVAADGDTKSVAWKQARQISAVLKEKPYWQRSEVLSYTQRALKADQSAAAVPGQKSSGGADFAKINEQVNEVVDALKYEVPGWSTVNAKYVKASESMNIVNTAQSKRLPGGIEQDKLPALAKSLLGSELDYKDLVEKLGPALSQKFVDTVARVDKASVGTSLASKAAAKGVVDTSAQTKRGVISFARRLLYDRRASVDAVNFFQSTISDAEVAAQAKLLLSAGTEKDAMFALRNIAELSNSRKIALPKIAEMEGLIASAFAGSQADRALGE